MSDQRVTDQFVVRMVPEVEAHTAVFWQSGLRGELVVPACRACGHLLLPPAPVCNRCRCRELDQRVLSGRGTVLTYSVNVQPWMAGMDEPVVLAVIELEEEAGLRLLVTLAGAAVDTVRVGCAVEIRFAPSGDIAVPYAVLAPS